MGIIYIDIKSIVKQFNSLINTSSALQLLMKAKQIDPKGDVGIDNDDDDDDDIYDDEVGPK